MREQLKALSKLPTYITLSHLLSFLSINGIFLRGMYDD